MHAHLDSIGASIDAPAAGLQFRYRFAPHAWNSAVTSWPCFPSALLPAGGSAFQHPAMMLGSFPAKTRRAAPKSTTLEPIMLPEQKQILVVDDEPNLRRVLSAQLARDGYEVHTAEDGQEALSMLRDHHI